MAGRADVPRLRTTVSTTARAARLRAGLSQADVAEEVGVVTDVYGRFERSTLLPSVPTLRELPPEQVLLIGRLAQGLKRRAPRKQTKRG